MKENKSNLIIIEEIARYDPACLIKSSIYCQTTACTFGWVGYNLIESSSATHPDKYKGDKIKQHLENKNC